MITASMHHTEEVLDPTYRPSNEYEATLFREKQTFMFHVLNNCLLTDEGKTVVREFAEQRDAQKVWEKYSSMVLRSSKTRRKRREIMSYLASTFLDSNW